MALPTTTITDALGITAGALTLNVASAANLPLPGGQFTIGGEQIKYTTVTGLVVSGLTRGVNSTTAAPHPFGATVTIAPLNTTATSLTVVSVAGFPATGVINVGTEYMTYSAIVGTTLTVARGALVTTKASATNGALVNLSTLKHTAWAGGAGGLPTAGSAYTVQSHFPLGLPNLAYKLASGVRRADMAVYDINKDGVIDSTDGGLVAKLSGTCLAGAGAQTNSKPIVQSTK
jgi:hypothetical protein